MADEVKGVDGWSVWSFECPVCHGSGGPIPPGICECAWCKGVGRIEDKHTDTEWRALLLSQGLRIVGEAEWAVLEAMDAFEDGEFGSISGEHFLAHNGKEDALCKAQFARRAAKGE